MQCLTRIIKLTIMCVDALGTRILVNFNRVSLECVKTYHSPSCRRMYMLSAIEEKSSIDVQVTSINHWNS